MNLLVIIRSIGERTEDLCRERIIDQGILADDLVIVKESPFSEALKRSFEIGIQRNKKWTLCIDADVLLKSDGIEALVHYAEQQDGHTFEVQGYVFDKFINGPRMAGNHLYRTEFFPKALSILPDIKNEIRPEASTLKMMASFGYPYCIYPKMIGVHDFEQYYVDIYRKAFIQSRKHLHFTNLFVDTWKSNPIDMDFQVALKGFAAGLICLEDVLVDKGSELINGLWDAEDIGEKGSKIFNDFSSMSIDHMLESWTASNTYKRHGKLLETEFFYKPKQHENSTTSTILKKIGFLGYLIRKVGERIQNFSKQ